MHIDWKTVSRSEGYRSLKAAMVDSQKSTHRSTPKAELHKQFQWIIGLALYYAIRQDRELHHVLNQWELERQGNWFGWYCYHRHPKLPSGKPRNVKPINRITYLRTDRWNRDPIRRFDSIRTERTSAAREQRKALGKKARWSPHRKRQSAIVRRYRQQQSL